MNGWVPPSLNEITWPIVWDIGWWLFLGATFGIAVRYPMVWGFAFAWKLHDRLLGVRSGRGGGRKYAGTGVRSATPQGGGQGGTVGSRGGSVGGASGSAGAIGGR